MCQQTKHRQLVQSTFEAVVSLVSVVRRTIRTYQTHSTKRTAYYVS